MTTKTIYLPTVYVDEATGEIIEKEQLKNLSYKSKLITNIEKSTRNCQTRRRNNRSKRKSKKAWTSSSKKSSRSSSSKRNSRSKNNNLEETSDYTSK